MKRSAKRQAAVAPAPTPPRHRIVSALLKRKVRVLVVGCGGNGSEIVSGLPYLHQALLAWGHPGGLDVLLMDGDIVSSTNIVRQVFAPGDVGHPKVQVLVNRLNAFWGLEWRAVAQHLSGVAPLVDTGYGRRRQGLGADIVIGCVDSRGGRAAIRDRVIGDGKVYYWLDLGNDASSGQFVLGMPFVRPKKRRTVRGEGELAAVLEGNLRLPTIDELFPETVNAKLDKKDTLPSCSAQEALERQEPFVNRTIAAHALAMLTRLFRYGELAHHGAFINVAAGRMVPIPVSPEYWARVMKPARKTA